MAAMTKAQTLAWLRNISGELATETLKRTDLSTVCEGDIFIGNDAHTGGGTHLNDIVFLEPVFVDGQIVAWVANLAHHSDFVDRGHAQYAGRLTQPEQLRFVRQGHGQSGINRDYVLATVDAIEAQGCRDKPLHQLAAALRGDAAIKA